MKAIQFLISSQIFIGFAAVALAIATAVQLGSHPIFDVSLAVIFFATLFDYNLHGYLKVHHDLVNLNGEKTGWAAKNLVTVKILIFVSLAGISVSLFFVSTKVFCLLGVLALPTILYSYLISRHSILLRLKALLGTKILLIAFTWSAVTILVPLVQSGIDFSRTDVLLIFAERFTLILALSIPFDIRDIENDTRTGIKTIPISLGANRAILICNLALCVSMLVAFVHYMARNMTYILPAYSVSGILILVFINNKKIRHLPFYYHGILDGSINLHGFLLSLASI